MKKRDIVIGGYAETPIDFKTGRSAYDLAGEALDQLLERTGIDKSEIDGLSVTTALSEAQNPFFAVYMTEALGITPTWLNYGGIGGCSATGGVARAMSAIRDGMCKLAVVMSSDAPSSDWRSNYGAYRGEFQDPPGVQGPPATFGLLMSRYIHQYGLGSGSAGQDRGHAARACAAQPQRLQEVPEGAHDGRVPEVARHRRPAAGARQRDVLRRRQRVHRHDRGEREAPGPEEDGLSRSRTARSPTSTAPIRWPTSRSRASRRSAPKCCARPGLAPKDVRMFQPYDDFTIAVLMQFEAFGFCEPRRRLGVHAAHRPVLQTATCRSTPAAVRSRPGNRAWPAAG
jgi:acetyl-CoA acetyltransferase